MPSGPIRRSQLIAPFGVGGLVVSREGISLICTGLDHWYKREDGLAISSTEEFTVREWRLERQLNVSHLRLPPDFRTSRPGHSIPNSHITIPFLRFPQWHFCPYCNRLHRVPSAAKGRIECRECSAKGRKRYLYQVPFIAVCDNGHIQDFPWREWVHRSTSPQCEQPLRLQATGGTSLAGQIVKCDCGMQRSLAQITSAAPTGEMTELTASLDRNGAEYRCQGHKPWLEASEPAGCGRPLRGSLRSASNVYFPVVKSAIYLPRSTEVSPPELISLFENPPVSGLLHLLVSIADAQKIRPEHVRSKYPQALEPYSDVQIQSALNTVLGLQGAVVSPKDSEVVSDDQETKFRRMEHAVLSEPRDEQALVIEKVDLEGLDIRTRDSFSRIMLIKRLRETRALTGFTRLTPYNGQDLSELRSLLWTQTPDSNRDWLPAYVVHGEGIFIALDESRLQDWEIRSRVVSRNDSLTSHYEALCSARNLRPKAILPRFVLIHTLAHLLINRLTFECGYSSASLRERLYVSADHSHPMGALLLYTAAGDAEGTLGGLVRMGEPRNFEPVLRRAIEDARWCSADPVCMEVATHGGQGPDSCNLAACHSCALVPETACEEFNRFLDRGFVVGDTNLPEIGYFSDR